MKTANSRKPIWCIGILLLLVLATVWFCNWFFKPAFGLEQMVPVWYCEVDGQMARYIERRPESRFDRLVTRLTVGERYAVHEEADAEIYLCGAFPQTLAVKKSDDTGYCLLSFEQFCTPEEIALIGDYYARIP